MRRTAPFVVIALCALGFTSCGTSSQNAYPTVQALASAGVANRADEVTLAAGRKIYTTSCTECHVARPVARFSVKQWRHILGVMAPRARLKSSDREALETYLVAARESVPPG